MSTTPTGELYFQSNSHIRSLCEPFKSFSDFLNFDLDDKHNFQSSQLKLLIESRKEARSLYFQKLNQNKNLKQLIDTKRFVITTLYTYNLIL